MMLSLQFDCSLPVVLTTAYGILLVGASFGAELIVGRSSAQLDFAELLDGVEAVWGEGTVLANQSGPALGGRKRTLSDKEILRRISRNAQILSHLSQLYRSQACAEDVGLIKRVCLGGIRLGILTWLLQHLIPPTRRVPGLSLFLKPIGKSYWSMVQSLYSLYRRHHLRQSEAFSIAFNLA